MSAKLTEAIGEAAIILIAGVHFTLRSRKPAPEWIVRDLDKLERYERSNKTFRWAGPFLIVVSIIFFLIKFYG